MAIPITGTAITGQSTVLTTLASITGHVGITVIIMATATSVGIGDTLETVPWIRFMHFPECARVLRPDLRSGRRLGSLTLGFGLLRHFYVALGASP
jgi:hypothetical protein